MSSYRVIENGMHIAHLSNNIDTFKFFKKTPKISNKTFLLKNEYIFVAPMMEI